jgi:Flp pilus assembly protein TadG
MAFSCRTSTSTLKLMFRSGRVCEPTHRAWSNSRRAALIVRFLHNNAGVTAVESATVIPLVILILLGTVEFGRTLKAWNEVGHALGKAVRVVNIKSGTSTADVEELIGAYLAEINTETLSVNATMLTLSGKEYMNISVKFPFNIMIPFWGVPTLSLEVETRAPIIVSPLK